MVWRFLVLSAVSRFVNDRRSYQVFFLRDDNARSVRVDEVSSVDFDVVKLHLDRGESVFITQRKCGAELRSAKGRTTEGRVPFVDERGAKDFSRNAGNPLFLIHT
jgi:hypothetical protein